MNVGWVCVEGCLGVSDSDCEIGRQMSGLVSEWLGEWMDGFSVAGLLG